MKQSIFLILLLNIFLSPDLMSQSSYPMTVIAQPNLKMRKEPNSKGKFLNSIPFGETVKVLEASQNRDTLNGFVNHWMLVEHQGNKGYVWGQYLSWLKMSNDKKHRVMYEGTQCSELNYDPALNWYGVYKTEQKDVYDLIKVKVKLVFRESILRADWTSEGFANEEDFIISTDREDKSYLLIGTKLTLEEDSIFGRSNAHGFLYPTQWLNMAFENGMYLAMKAKITPYLDSSSLEITQKYELELATNRYGYNRYNQGPNAKKQNITKHVPYIEGSGEINATYKNPVITWYGDIDGGNQIDLLISSHHMVEACGGGITTVLLLSSEAEGDEFVGKADEFNAYGCGGC